jgi:hypothetical protein
LLYAIATPEPAGEIVESGLPDAILDSELERTTVMEAVGTGE